MGRLEFGKSQRVVENMENWIKPVAMSYVVPAMTYMIKTVTMMIMTMMMNQYNAIITDM